MTQETAHATDIMSHPTFHQKKDARTQRGEITNALQITLDTEQLLNLFSRSVQPLTGHNGFTYTHISENLNISGGTHAHHSCSYQLIVEQDDLGELKLMRRKRFSAEEIKQIEEIICCLVYPLRNTLMYRRALKSAHTDPLTQVNNRISMDDCIQREWDLAHRQKTPLSMMLLDIDHFKQINDQYGHSFGDTVLKAVAQCIKTTVRASDIVFRYGGEEFVVVLSNTEMEGAALLAERIRQTVESLLIYEDQFRVSVTVSLGVTQMQANDSVKQLFVHADQAMYQAKKNGRNRVMRAP